MRDIELIPAIDIIDGKCVRLTKGEFDSKKIYGNDPLEIAKLFNDNGFKRLHLVDLDGAREGRIVNYGLLEKIAIHTSLSIDFGGGVKSMKDIEIAFESGAKMITAGSVAVSNESFVEKWIDIYGNERIILGADVKDYKISISGWQESTDIDLFNFIKSYRQKGIKKVICTDIGRDGTLSGPAVDLYRRIIASSPDIYIIASGGVGSLKDIENLHAAGVPAVIFGKAFYEGKISIEELNRFMIC